MFYTTNPFTGKVLGEYRYQSAAELDQRIRNSWHAYEIWNQSSLELRSRLFFNLAIQLRKSAKYLATSITTEMGKPISEALAEVEKSAFNLEYIAQNIWSWLAPGKLQNSDGKSIFETEIQGLGPLFCIMPWNFPIWQLTRALISGLAVGNSVLYKGSDLTAGTNAIFAEVCTRAIQETNGLDERCSGGLIQNLLIDHGQSGQVIQNPLVRGVTFTGSTRGGIAVAALSGASLKKTVLELGGNDAYLMLEDADFKQAGKLCAISRLINSGQSCIAAKRFFIPQSKMEEFLHHFQSELSNRVVGDPLSATTNLGVLAKRDFVSSTQVQRDLLINEGARSVFSTDYVSTCDCFYQPEILQCKLDLKEAHQVEIFAPVALVFAYTGLEECLSAINSSNFGLGAAVFSQDILRAKTVGQKINVGMLAINDFVKSDVRLPFGGVKDSGFGRELSQFGILEFANRRAVIQAQN
jgi:succinate-semialdehyde dehydrogenase/glutarate-semialdehyde dehydrogenase